MICRVCDHDRLELAVDLGEQPWANNFLEPKDVGKEPFYPLRVVYCPRCCCAQLDYTVRKEVMFAQHTYLSGTTETLRNHFRKTAETMDKLFLAGRASKSVLDIGSNDGTQLKQYKDIGFDVLGVESCAPIAEMAEKQGVSTLAAFFNLETARKIGRKFNLINASGVFFHLEELHSVTDGIRESLERDGVFVVQFLYMKSILENLAFDQIYHEHLLYYTIRTISALLARHGLQAFDAYWDPIHGGTIVLMAGHAGVREPTERLKDLLAQEDAAGTNTLGAYLTFGKNIAELKKRVVAELDGYLAQKKVMYGLGAPVKGNTMLNYFKVGTKHLQCLVERNALRRGLVSPGMHIPIRIEDELERPPDVYFVLAWNFKQEILKRYADLIKNGVKFVFPINPKQTS